MAKLRNPITYFFVFIILYIYIFNPIFVAIGIGLVKALLLLSILYYLLKREYVKAYIPDCRNLYTLLFLSIIYCTLIIMLSSGNSNAPYSIFIWILECTFIPIFLIRNIFLKYNLCLFETLVNVSLFAACISVFLFLNPSINDFVQGGVVELPYENKLGKWDRCFGIAEGLTNSYGVIQGIFASLCLLKGKQSSKYYLFAFIITISVAINARTGWIPIIFTLLYVTWKNIKSGKIMYFVSIAIAVWSVMFFIEKYGGEHVNTIEFSLGFFTSSYDFFINGDTGDDYYGALNRFIHFPQSFLGILLGEGKTMFGDPNHSSDIGYINQIYTGGLVYLITLIITQIMIYKKLYYRYKYHFLIFLLFATAFIINFKGITFYTSESFSRFVMLFYFVVLHNKMFPNKKITIGL